MGHPMKSDGSIDGSSGWLLCDILCDEGCERESAWRQILPRRADGSTKGLTWNLKAI